MPSEIEVVIIIVVIKGWVTILIAWLVIQGEIVIFLVLFGVFVWRQEVVQVELIIICLLLVGIKTSLVTEINQTVSQLKVVVVFGP